MHWNSLGEFFAMGGYALYVWGSFGACALTMLAEPLLVMRRQRSIRRELLRERLAKSLDSVAH
uniref:Heme exporter protein D n=1 Tax=uncultured bacterium UPO46 TaxID=1776971 RepID=A0A126SY37_9BACT|nr:heme exporter protein CcmD [uncultured bacterium UPO46]